MNVVFQLLDLFLIVFLLTSCGNNGTGPNPDSDKTGTLKVTTQTTGKNDNEYYRIYLEADDFQADIGNNETIYLHPVSEGIQSVKLLDVPSNCMVQGKNLRKIHVTAGDTTSTNFIIKCSSSDELGCKVTPAEIGSFTNYIGSHPSMKMKQALADMINKYGVRFGITTKAHLQHFLAQTAEETGGYTILVESFNYTAKRLLEIFGKYFSRTDPSKADPDEYAGHPEKIANLTYANRLGNGPPSSGDGYRYRGRGIIQITGRANYRGFTNYYQAAFDSSKNFVTHPKLVASDRDIAVISGLKAFKRLVLDRITVDENTTVKEITLLVNGGLNGIDIRRKDYSAVQATIPNCR